MSIFTENSVHNLESVFFLLNKWKKKFFDKKIMFATKDPKIFWNLKPCLVHMHSTKIKKLILSSY